MPNSAVLLISITHQRTTVLVQLYFLYISSSYDLSGHKILNGQKKIELEKGQITEVKMSVQYMSFSAHADAKGQFTALACTEEGGALKNPGPYPEGLLPPPRAGSYSSLEIVA